MSNLLSQLNDKQAEAVKNTEGPVLILAGAGSGKTRTITYRIAYMIEELNIKPYNILAVTFTNKAANEMKKRVADLVKENYEMITISTFHSFGVKLLRQYGERIGYYKNFVIYDQEDQKKIISKIIKSKNYQIGTSEKRSIINKILKYKEGVVSKENLPYDIEEILYEYNNELKNNNAMDFSDILINTNKILNFEDILEKVQTKYKYIMIDEYQDTNNIQYEIVRKIANKYKNICVVGDDNQSIYAFRGANIGNILNFGEDYSNAKIIKLEENYRSTSNILDAANSIIKNNESSIYKNLWTKRKGGDKIFVIESENGRSEAIEVANKILELNKENIRYKDIAILYRANSQSRLFEEVFIRNNIRYKVFGGTGFFERAEIKDIIAYLSVIVNHRDELNLTRIINIPKRNIGAKGIEKIVEYARNHKITMYDSLKFVDEISGITSNAKENLKKLIDMLENYSQLSGENSASYIVENLIKEVKYIDYLKEEYENYDERIENIEELINSIYEYEKLLGFFSLEEYLESVSLTSATDDLSEDDDYVKLMTVHNAKGLEFPVVFIVGFENEYFPGNWFEIEELEEERRICYVAITRAENTIYISHSKTRMLYGENLDRSPSQFLSEIPKELLFNLNQRKEKIKTITDLSNARNFLDASILSGSANTSLKIGDRVIHKKFGIGIVTATNSKKVTVSFLDGKKDILSSLAEKVLIKQK